MSELIERYMVSPENVITVAREDVRDRLSVLIKLGTHELAKFKLHMERRVRFIAKIVSYRFTQYGELVVTFPNGIDAYLSLSKVSHSPEEFYELIRTPLLWDVALANNRPVVISYSEILSEPSYDIADKLLSQYAPVDILIAGMGYQVKPDVARVLIPRLLPLIKTPYPIHVWQFTRPNTAKTHIGVTYMLYFNWFYSTSLPSKAGLLYDARTGTYGYALTSDGLVFDEVDKWSVTKIVNEEFLTYMPTLMEQGIVVRPTTRRTFIGVIERRIPVMYLGNIPDIYGNDNSRVTICNFVMGWGDRTCALVDRVAICDVNRDYTYITDYLTNRMLPESVIRAVVELINKDVKVSDKSSLSGRLRRHANMVASALEALGFPYEDMRLIDEVVMYGWSDTLTGMRGPVEGND